MLLSFTKSSISSIDGGRPLRSIMSIFDWGYDEPLIQNSVIREPEHTEYVPEQEYQWDNPIIMDLEF